MNKHCIGEHKLIKCQAEFKINNFIQVSEVTALKAAVWALLGYVSKLCDYLVIRAMVTALFTSALEVVRKVNFDILLAVL